MNLRNTWRYVKAVCAVYRSGEKDYDDVLCRKEDLENTSLAGDAWSEIPEVRSRKREVELVTVPGFLGWIIKQGSKICCHTMIC